MFKFSGSENERLAVANKFKEALEELPLVIPVLEAIEVGINVNPDEHWDLVLTAVVPKYEDIALYSAHPAHVAATGIIADHKLDRACVDYAE